MTTLKHLLPENDNGNIEYKWKLCNIPSYKIAQLATQMLFRLTEGNGHAEYYLGVTDKGDTTGILKSELNTTLYNLFESCKLLGVKILYYKTYIQNVDNNGLDRYCIHLKVRKLDLPSDKISL